MLLGRSPCLTKQDLTRCLRCLSPSHLKQTTRRRPEGCTRRLPPLKRKPTRTPFASRARSGSAAACGFASIKRTEISAADEAVLPRLRAAALVIAKLMGMACVCSYTLNWLGSCSAVGRFACLAAQEAPKGMAAWTGLSAGFLHTLAGPDHLAGLTPLTLGQKQATAVSMGALWGFGHSSGQLLLGLIFLILKGRFHGIVPFLSRWAGAVVGLTLIGIGIMGIYESRFEEHDSHEADAEAQAMAQLKERSLAKRGIGTYAMGFIYGLQPDSLFVVLPALTLPTRLATLSYVLMFVIGTVCAMAGYTLAIGTASEAAVQRRPWLLQHLSTLAASVALIVGIFILLPSLGCQLPFVA